MTDLLPVIRLLHVLFGAFWAGTVFFNVLILEPRLAALGPRIQQPVMSSIMPRLVPAMMLSGIMVFVTGVLLTPPVRSGRIEMLLASGWGTAIAVGIVATLGAIAVGFGGLTPTGIRLGRLAEQLKGQHPSPEQSALASRLSHRMDMLSRVNFALVFIAVAAMPLARFL